MIDSAFMHHGKKEFEDLEVVKQGGEILPSSLIFSQRY